VRDGEPCLLAEERSLARLDLRGLRPAEARGLLERSAPGRLAPTVAEALLAACAGNPLGLIELPLVLTGAQRRGEEPLPSPLEAGPLVRRAFAARASRLEPESRRALRVLAAAGEADVALLLRLDSSPETVDSLEASGLVSRRGETLGFRHPLVWSAVYSAMTPRDRRDAHRIVAGALDGARRAWHLAEAAAGADEQVAEALEAAAEETRAAGGRAAEAQALERAAELTPEEEPRARRLLEAGRAWRLAGRIEHVNALLERALPLAAAVRTRGEIQHERASTLIRDGDVGAALGILLAEADRALPSEPELAGQLLVKAAVAAHLDADVSGAAALAERGLALAGGDGGRLELEAVNALVEV
jgi:hypothetical protein